MPRSVNSCMRFIKSVIATGVLVLLALAGGLVPAAAAGPKTYGYVTPGPDTWYKKDVDGFVYAAQKAGAKVIVLNSNYDPEKEIANIDSLINLHRQIQIY